MKFNEMFGVYMMGVLSATFSYAIFFVLKGYYGFSIWYASSASGFFLVLLYVGTSLMFPIEKLKEVLKNG